MYCFKNNLSPPVKSVEQNRQERQQEKPTHENRWQLIHLLKMAVTGVNSEFEYYTVTIAGTAIANNAM